jgi:hypothetical protein
MGEKFLTVRKRCPASVEKRENAEKQHCAQREKCYP